MSKTIDRNILSSAQAYNHCIESGNSKWEQRHWEHMVETLLDHLPHGSGIDCEWDFEIDKGNLICSNSYHVMNDNGMYNGYIDFKLIIKIDRRDIYGNLDWKLQGKLSQNNGLKEYLEDTFNEALGEL